MSLRFTIGPWLVPRVVLFEPQRAEQAAQATILPALEEASLYALRQVQDSAPVGATAQLRGSIQQAVEIVRGTPVAFRGEVFTLAPHARPVEEGSKPHWAPIAPLKLWARRLLGNERLAWAVQRTIAQRGTRPTWFFRDATTRATPRALAIVRAGWQRYIDRLTGRT